MRSKKRKSQIPTGDLASSHASPVQTEGAQGAGVASPAGTPSAGTPKPGRSRAWKALGWTAGTLLGAGAVVYTVGRTVFSVPGYRGAPSDHFVPSK